MRRMQIAEGSHELEAILNRADADITKKGNIIVTFKSAAHAALQGGILKDDGTVDLKAASRKAEDLMKLLKKGQERYTQCMLLKVQLYHVCVCNGCLLYAYVGMGGKGTVTPLLQDTLLTPPLPQEIILLTPPLSQENFPHTVSRNHKKCASKMHIF